jgi:Arc-like DNA binding domain
MARKLTNTVQLNLRFSEALRRRLEREADRNDRSMNAEIIHRLEQSFRAPELTDAVVVALEARFKKIEEAIFNYATKTTEG